MEKRDPLEDRVVRLSEDNLELLARLNQCQGRVRSQAGKISQLTQLVLRQGPDVKFDAPLETLAVLESLVEWYEHPSRLILNEIVDQAKTILKSVADSKKSP